MPAIMPQQIGSGVAAFAVSKLVENGGAIADSAVSGPPMLVRKAIGAGRRGPLAPVGMGAGGVSGVWRCNWRAN